MTKHPDHVEGWNGSLEDLAIAVGKMRYDKLAEFIRFLRSDIEKQKENDQKNGRPLLATKLAWAATSLSEVEDDLIRAWKICEPHMQ